MMEPKIHPTAIISSKAELAPDVTIGPFCCVGDEVKLASGVILESHVSIEGPTEIGVATRIWPFASIGGDPQDLKYANERTTLKIGSQNQIRENVTINRGTEGGGGKTVIGDRNLMMAGTHVGHDCQIGSDIIFANAATLAGHVEVGDGATVGAFSGVHQFCRVAKYAFIGGYSVVTQDALPWVMTVGNRATTHGVNLVGMKRKGYPKETIRAIKQCYVTLFRSKLRMEEAISQIEAEFGTIPEVQYFLEFVKTSKRGVVR